MNHFHPNASLPVILTVAGFDPSGGAGTAADLKTFASHNCYGVAALTALTTQNTQGVSAVEPIKSTMLKICLETLLADGQIKAVKVGMLATRANAEVVREFLESNAALPGVLDPVLRSSSGMELLDAAGFEFLRDHLLERALVVTGGHLEKPVDVYFDGTELEAFAADRVKSDNFHGTGCAFSSAIAANLAFGRQLRDSVMLAKAYVTEAIRKAYPVGPGRLPLNHLFRMQQGPRLADPSPAVAETVH